MSRLSLETLTPAHLVAFSFGLCLKWIIPCRSGELFPPGSKWAPTNPGSLDTLPDD